MSDALVHRGPDGEGSLVDGPVALGDAAARDHRPRDGHQPLSNEDGAIALVGNGEIYNYRALRRELERAGHGCARTATPR